MKNRILTIFTVLLSNIGLAQTNSFPGSGNTGIGTLSPLTVLDIRGGNILVKNLNNVLDESAIMIDHSLSFGSYQNFGTSLRTYTQSAANNTYALQFFTQDSYLSGQKEKMRINGNGDIGIGTTNPRAIFDIAPPLDGNKLGSVLGRLNEGNNNGEGTFLGVRGYSTVLATGGKSFALEHSFYGTVNNSINFFRGESVTGGAISFNTDENTERVRITTNGNVGIGITNPAQRLAVNGNIRAKEIIVETANWPDYVFDDDYKNLGLSELEQYIKMNKHLPDVPSAGKIEQDGLALGEMNKILLKKIEELTLHLIEKDKAILSLRADKKNTEVQMEDFRKRLAQLESVLKKN